jgi:predicted short-subunit dehydrogenase-like oxidoreductase (DUF2520 family)
MKVVMVGSGNTATVLCAVIKKSGHEIVQVASRNIAHAKQLADIYQVDFASLYDEHFAEADIYIIALNDVALENLEKIPGIKNKLLVHTAGSVSIDALKERSGTYGVLYPLQTLSKLNEHLPEIPFLVDGSNKETLHRILGFAKTLSENVTEADDTARLNYHVAAVFVSNFTNHMYALAEKFCDKEKIDFKNLMPVISEVTDRLAHHSPFLTQTGPAMRDDVYTLNKHLQALGSYPDLKYVYLKLSESIIKSHKKN